MSEEERNIFDFLADLEKARALFGDDYVKDFFDERYKERYGEDVEIPEPATTEKLVDKMSKLKLELSLYQNVDMVRFNAAYDSLINKYINNREDNTKESLEYLYFYFWVKEMKKTSTMKR